MVEQIKNIKKGFTLDICLESSTMYVKLKRILCEYGKKLLRLELTKSGEMTDERFDNVTLNCCAQRQRLSNHTCSAGQNCEKC